ncbi:general secretion pathway protein [Novosphingobium fuchskuhlense]|uniref:General secretion pathway protein n=1 Tax=Novosphingobium fuchskuhlense TaxID=1117702 RepID=A0A117UVS1_9SPHN|nr:XrtA/PEP-CTERM system-associated ATPase [Novosphingobium fuchskuhlense]KUR71751.1 general secretion pathway protein [Novosphingobium fuchskuhlense]
MYDTFYKLTGRPFQLTPDPEFYFESGTHRKALSYLGYGLAQGEGFIVITGAVGAGKSTLAAHLLATIDRQRLTAAQIVTSRLDGGEMVHMAARAFGLAAAGHDKASALALIEAFLHEEARAGRRCLLVVDETQNLSIEALEELRMLSNFQLGAHPLLQILLLGQPEFRDLLQNSPRLEQLRQRVIATHHLDAMQPEEVGPYVLHRLACVGWNGNPAFDARVFADLAKATGCLPRRINQVVGRLMLMGAVEQKSRIEPAMLAEVIADLERDGTLADPDAPAPAPAPLIAAEAPAAPAPSSAAPQASPSAAAIADLAGLQKALAAHADQIVELQRAVLELADMPAPPAGASETESRFEALEAAQGALQQRIVMLEARGAEQEQAIRHVLTMLIEWLENETPRRAA